MYRKRKDIRKKIHLAAFVFIPSEFGEKFPDIWILNDIGRNFLLGNRKKTAKCLMRPSTCRSTFLYGEHILLITTQTQPQRELKRSLGQVVFFKFLILRGSWLMHCVLSAHAQLHSHSNISPPPPFSSFSKVLRNTWLFFPRAGHL